MYSSEAGPELEGKKVLEDGNKTGMICKGYYVKAIHFKFFLVFLFLKMFYIIFYIYSNIYFDLSGCCRPI